MNALPLSRLALPDTFLCDSVPQPREAVQPGPGSLLLLLLPPPAEERKPARRAEPSTRRKRRRSWRQLQQALPFSLPTKTVTPLMQKIFDIVQRNASAKSAMPTNAELASILGRGRQSIAKAFDRLVALGRLRVDVKRGYRRVYVVGKSSITAWGEHRQGHAPFSKYPKGTAPAPDERIVPVSLGRGDGFSFLGVAPGQEFAYRNAVNNGASPAGPTRECQFITSDVKNYYPTYCEEVTLLGKSWCLQHNRVVFGR